MILSTVLVALATPTFDQSLGDWKLGVGVGYPDIKSDSGTLAGMDADIDSDIRPIINAEYYIRDNPGIEPPVATPFEHNITLGGSTSAGSTKL